MRDAEELQWEFAGCAMRIIVLSIEKVMLRSPRKKLRYILEIVGASIVYLT